MKVWGTQAKAIIKVLTKAVAIDKRLHIITTFMTMEINM